MKNKNNTAKKITPAVGMILALKSAVMSKRTGPAKVLTVNPEKGNVIVYRPGARVPQTVIAFSSLNRYRPTTASEFPGVDFDENNGGRSTLTDAPPPAPVSEEVPVNANDNKPKSEPPPATDTTPASTDINAIVRADFLEAQRRADARVDKLEGVVNSLATMVASIIQHKAEPAPVKTKQEEREETDMKTVREQTPWATPQFWRFVSEEMEFVTFNTRSEIDRALEPGEVFEQFELWCKVNALLVPFQRTVFSIMLSDDRTRDRHKLSSKKEKTRLAIRRQTRFGFDESQSVGKDVQDIMDHARRTAWPSLPESHRETVGKLLLSGKVAKADILAAIDHVSTIPNRGPTAYSPDMVLDVRHIRALARIARAEGSAK